MFFFNHPLLECRGNAIAAGLLFRSHEAEAEGSTAIIYDWDRNQLEAIFNVPSNWQPAAATTTPTMDGVEGDIFDDIEGFFDPAAALNTPRYQVSSIASIPAVSYPFVHAINFWEENLFPSESFESCHYY